MAAPDAAQLVTACRAALADLEKADSPTCYGDFLKATALREIANDHARLGFVSCSRDEAISLLRLAIADLEKNRAGQAWDTPEGIYFRSQSLAHEGAVVALFSGQGSQ